MTHGMENVYVSMCIFESLSMWVLGLCDNCDNEIIMEHLPALRIR